MARAKISKKFLDLFSEKLMEAGNIAAGALVFGQFIGGQTFSYVIFITGVITWVGMYIASFIINQKR